MEMEMEKVIAMKSSGDARNGSPKYELLKKSLIQKIHTGKMKGGQRLPSEYDLQVKHGVSNTTARKCLEELSREGYIYRVQGKGSFVSHLAHICSKKTIGILCTGLISIDHPYVSEIVHGLEESLDDEEYMLEVLPQTLFSAASHPGHALAELVGQRNIHGLFVISPMPSEWLEELVKVKFPIVSINIDFKESLIPTVLFDMENSTKKALEYLYGCGYRRVCVLCGRYQNRPQYIDDCYDHVSNVVEGHFSQKEYSDFNVLLSPYDWFSKHQVYQLAADILKDNEKPLAVLAVERRTSQHVLGLCGSMGFEVPREVGVMLVTVSSEYPINTTGIFCNIENLTWRAVRILEQLREGERPKRLKEAVKGKLLERETTNHMITSF